jgi:hypothetical protein
METEGDIFIFTFFFFFFSTFFIADTRNKKKIQKESTGGDKIWSHAIEMLKVKPFTAF